MSLKVKLQDLRYAARPWHFQLVGAVVVLGLLAWTQTRQPSIEDLGQQLVDQYGDAMQSPTIEGRETAGLTWTLSDLPPDAAQDIAWDGERFVAAGVAERNGERQFLLSTSSDGLRWDEQAIETGAAGEPGRVFRIGVRDGVLMINAERFLPSPGAILRVSTPGVLLLSEDDGRSWTEGRPSQGLPPADQSYNYIAGATLHGGRLYVASAHSDEMRLLTSDDLGATWQRLPPPTRLGAVDGLLSSPAGVLISGIDADNTPHLHAFDPATRTWSPMPIPDRIEWVEQLERFGDSVIGSGYDLVTDGWARFRLTADAEWEYLPLEDDEFGAIGLAVGPVGEIHVGSGTNEIEPGVFSSAYTIEYTAADGTDFSGVPLADVPDAWSLDFTVGQSAIVVAGDRRTTEEQVLFREPGDLDIVDPTLADYVASIPITNTEVWQLTPIEGS